MFYNTKQLKLKVNNMDFDYITFGSGNKNLIMIQGLNTNGINGSAIPLAFMYKIFAKEYKVYLFDRRPILTQDITIDDMALDIAGCMDVLNISKSYILGVSQGGMIASSLAIKRPDLVNKLVLAVTTSKNNETLVNVVNNWIDLTNKNNYKELVKDMLYKMYSDKYIKKYKIFLPLLTMVQKPKDKQRFITLAKSCLTCTTYDSLNQISCPVLVIGGKKDNIVTKDASYEIYDKLGCDIYMYDNLGHALYEEAKDFNQTVYDFFKK